jgi:DNA-binding transcriptional regulator LsrR (DeoR family)
MTEMHQLTQALLAPVPLLRLHGPMRTGAVAKHLGLSRQETAELLNELAQLGKVECRRLPFGEVWRAR